MNKISDGRTDQQAEFFHVVEGWLFPRTAGCQHSDLL